MATRGRAHRVRETLEPHRLYWVRDFLEANKEVMDRAIFFCGADLLSLSGDILFYNTISALRAR